MPKLPKVRFYHLFHYRWYTNFLSIAFVPNPILSNISTNPTQHPHFCNIKLIFLLAFYRPTFSPIQHRLSYNCSVKFSLKIEWHFFITNNTWNTLTFHPPSLNPITKSLIHVIKIWRSFILAVNCLTQPPLLTRLSIPELIPLFTHNHSLSIIY